MYLIKAHIFIIIIQNTYISFTHIFSIINQAYAYTRIFIIAVGAQGVTVFQAD